MPNCVSNPQVNLPLLHTGNRGPVVLPPTIPRHLRLVEFFWTTVRSEPWQYETKEMNILEQFRCNASMRWYHHTNLEYLRFWVAYSFIHSCLWNLQLSDSVQVTNAYFVQSARANVILVFGHYKIFFKLGVWGLAKPTLLFPFALICHLNMKLVSVWEVCQSLPTGCPLTST